MDAPLRQQLQVQHRAAAAAQQQAIPALPFTASSHEHIEPAFTFTVTPGSAAQAINPLDVPASGYLRAIYLEVVATGGSGGTIAADGPWNLFQSIHLHDVNGGKLYGPLDGYAAFISNLIGGYSNIHNPATAAPWYVGTAPNPAFAIRIPVEIARKNGFGSLANQSTASEYKLDLVINSLANMFSAAPSPVPTYTVKGWLEAWTTPAPQNSRGQMQSQVPPLLGSGQYWSSRVQSAILAGENTVRMTRVGNYLRTVAYIARNGSGVRDDTVMPDPIRWDWDGITIRRMSQRYSKQEFAEKASPLPAGVFVLPFNHGGEAGRIGNEEPDLWIPTSGASRIEINGISATAGSIQEIVNDVAPVEQSAAERYQVPNDTGTLANPVSA